MPPARDCTVLTHLPLALFIILLQESGPEHVVQRFPAETQRVSALPVGPRFGHLSARYAKQPRSMTRTVPLPHSPAVQHH